MSTFPCPTHKIVFGSRREATSHMRRSPHGNDGKSAYRCRLCEGWHVGHKPGKKPRQ